MRREMTHTCESLPESRHLLLDPGDFLPHSGQKVTQRATYFAWALASFAAGAAKNDARWLRKTVHSPSSTDPPISVC